jgi:hypothetical protein
MHQFPQAGKSIHALCSHMSVLDFLTEPPPPPVDYLDTDARDVTFVKVAGPIGERAAVEEYLACG